MSGPIGASSWMYGIEPPFYDYTIDQSLRLDDSSGAKLTISSASPTATNRQKVTVSCWVKRSFEGSGTYTVFHGGGNGLMMQFNSSNQMYIYDFGAASGGLQITSDRLFRDVGSWMHIVLILDSTQATNSNRLKLYINGELQDISSWGVGSGASRYPDLNANFNWHTGSAMRIGSTGSTDDMAGYIAEFVSVDGQGVLISNFGETKNGVWVPKDVSGLTLGNAGFHLDFANSADIGNDIGANNIDFTAASLIASDVVPDSPTNNFVTWNPLHPTGAAQGVMTLSEGNMKATGGSSIYRQAMGNMSVLSGKWYTETYISDAGYPSWHIGWTYGKRFEQFTGGSNTDDVFAGFGYFTGSNVYFSSFGETYAALQKPWSGIWSAGRAPTTGDVIGCAADFDNGKFWWSINGEWLNVGSGAGDPSNDSNPARTFTVATYADEYKSPWVMNYNGSFIFNAGQDSTFAGAITGGNNSDENNNGNFKYAPPSGFLALCSANLPELTISPNSDTQADDYFNTVLYNGNASTNAITGVGFSPNFVWIKNRSVTQAHNVFDTVRGAGKLLYPNLTNAEYTSSIHLNSFDSDGFTVGSATSANGSGNSIVAWNWKAGTSVSGTTTGSGTGQAYTGSVNTDAGFSIIAYTGNGTAGHTIPHHLGVAPKMVITKKRSSTGSWGTYHDDLTSASYYILLNDSAAQGNNNVYFNGTAPTNSVVTRGTGADGNANGVTYVQYAFAEIEGYSRIGSYIGNFNANGPFIFTGFKPAWLMLKRIDSADSWLMRDNKRDPYNVTDQMINANASNGEYTDSTLIDFVSNGFKLRHQNSLMNASGGTFIYLTFSEAPFKFANAR